MTDWNSPNVNNYAVGKGEVYFTPTGGARRHMGNAASVEIEPGVEELEHFSSMTGVRTKDLTVVLEKTLAVRLTLEEWTSENVAMALLGQVGENTEGNVTIDILSESFITGLLEFVGTNDVGPKWNYTFPSVSFRPNGALSPISDEWGQIELEGEVNAVGGSFGTAELQDSENATP